MSAINLNDVGALRSIRADGLLDVDALALDLAKSRASGLRLDNAATGWIRDVLAEGVARPEAFLDVALPLLAAPESRARSVWFGFADWMLADPSEGVIRFCGESPDCAAAVERVAELCRRWWTATKEEWEAAWAAAAQEAAWAAAWAAAAQEAAWAAREAAAWAAQEAEREAAWEGAWAAAWEAAAGERGDARERQAENRKRQAENRKRQAENRKRQAENRKRQAENRKRQAEKLIGLLLESEAGE